MDSIVIYKKVTNIFIYTCVCKKNRGPREAEKLHPSAITYKKGLRREKSGAKGKVGTALWKTILPIPKKKKRDKGCHGRTKNNNKKLTSWKVGDGMNTWKKLMVPEKY